MEDAVPPPRQIKECLVADVLSGALAPADMPVAYSAAVDSWLTGVFEGTVGERAKGFALVAVGGYGRGELCPGSDLDVMLVHQRRRDVREVADRVWYSVWDSGVRLDHSVRTPREAMSVAREDQKALLSMLDGRLIAGDSDLAAGLLADVDEWWRAHARELLGALKESGAERHARFGELAFLLEPDLKESAGGLRDIEAMALTARSVPRLASVLSPVSLAQHRRTLLGTRVALHARTGATGNRLLLQEQDSVAPLLGYCDADALMGAVAAAGREVMWTVADGWRRTASFLSGPLGRSGGLDFPVSHGVVLRDGEVAVEAGADGLGDASLLVRVATAAARYGVPIATSALVKLVTAEPIPTLPWSNDLRQSFLSLLEYGPEATRVLELLDQHHLLERLLPEWLEVRHRPQRNAYHRYTVDRHLLETVAQAALLIRSVTRPDLLLVAALLHDIGKGRGGDHSEAGRDMAVRIARRMGFCDADIDVLGRLVHRHLLLADTAVRRDLDDPATVAAVAVSLGDRQTLELLAALTQADSTATGPTAWSSWKAALVAELVSQTDAHLSGIAKPARGHPSRASAHQLEPASSGSLEVEIDGSTLTVIAKDRTALLSLVAGTLALHRLDVVSAVAMDGGDGMAIEVFEILRHEGAERSEALDVAGLRADLERALAGQLLISARIAELERAYARRTRPLAARPAEVRVLVDESASSLATVIEVRAPDSRGLLYRLTRVLAESGLDVVSARIATIGHEVVDSFYVRESNSLDRPGADRLADVLGHLALEAAPRDPA